MPTLWSSVCFLTELRSPPGGRWRASSSSFCEAHSISSVRVLSSWFHWSAFVSRRLLYQPRPNIQQSVMESHFCIIRIRLAAILHWSATFLSRSLISKMWLSEMLSLVRHQELEEMEELWGGRRKAQLKMNMGRCPQSASFQLLCNSCRRRLHLKKGH